MHERYRQIAFPSPLACPEMELDPERAVWVPHRRDRIFVPATAPPKPMFNVGTLTVKVDVDWKAIEVAFIKHMDMDTFAKEMQRSVEVFNRMASQVIPLMQPIEPRVYQAGERFALDWGDICDCAPGRHEFLDVTRLGDNIIRRQP